MMNLYFTGLAKVPTSAEMRLWDKAATDFGLPEVMLMENAGRQCFEVAMHRFGRPSNVILFMGSGNNGGDAACMARHFADAHTIATVYHTRELPDKNTSAGWHADLAMRDGVNFVSLNSPPEISAQSLLRSIVAATGRLPDLIVDGLLGTGFANELRPDMAKLVSAISDLASLSKSPILSIDVPSGLNSDNGKPSPVAIQSTVTVTLAAPKPGLLVPASRRWIGELVCRDIGIPRAVLADCPAQMRLLEGDSLLLLPRLPKQSYKNVYGHVCIFGGWRGYAGAAHLASLAALRAGAGLVTACAPEESLALIKNGLPEVMTYPAMAGPKWPHELSPKLIELIQKSTSLVIGPGLGRSEEAGSFLTSLLRVSKRPPAVIDADALAIMANQKELFQHLTANDIITPHPGEAGLILGNSGKEIESDRFGSLAKLCAISPAVCVLKGAGTLIGQAARPALFSPYDIPQLAVAGSGDALAGCIGALLGSGQFASMDSLSLAGAGVAMHAMAGLACDEIYPDRGNQPTQIANALCRSLQFVISQQSKKPEGIVPWPA